MSNCNFSYILEILGFESVDSMHFFKNHTARNTECRVGFCKYPRCVSTQFGSQALSVVRWGKRYVAVCRARLQVRRKMGALACEERSVAEV